MATNYLDPFGAPDYSAEGTRGLLEFLRDEYPRIYGAGAGLLGSTPYDTAGAYSVFDPKRQAAFEAAQVAFPVGLAAEVIPGVRSLKQPAMQLGRAGERLAERVVPQVMERGGMGAGLLGDLARGTRSPLDVYHGSPHGPFRQFDPTKIGTGEGAQVYGYGHYLGEARGTGETYRDTLAYKAFDLDPEAKKLGLNLSAGTRGEFIRQTRANKSPEVLAKQLQNANIAARDLPQDKLAKLFKAYNEKGGGYLYKVDLPDEQITKMLDWDKPMTEQEMISIYDRMQQSPLTGFAKTFQDNFYERMNRGQPTTDGQDLFMELSKELGGQKQVSDYLNSIGVPGIRYLDQMSRKPGVASLTQSQIDARINSLKSNIASGLGDQKRMKEILSSLEAERASHPKLTSNFVVFPGNENLLTIKEINDQPASLLFPTP